jgi:tetratricopeptide (TPR) repeat protein
VRLPSILLRAGAWLRLGGRARLPSPAAIAANQRGLAARDAGELEAAAAGHEEACRLAPRWEAPWFNLGVIYKHSGRWRECARACRRVLEIDPGSEGAAWNLGIASTALGDWPAAREAWRRAGLAVPDGEGPPALDLGPVPIRVDPRGEAEVVWCDRLDPARARVRSVPLPECGRRYGDLLLHDGAASGWRRLDGKEVPVFDELAVLQPSAYATFVVETEQPTAEDSLALAEVFEARGLPAEDWTLQVRTLCRACSEGRPHAGGEEHAAAAAWQPRHRVGVAARSAADVRAALAAWVAGGAGRRHGEIALGLPGAP